MQVIDDIMSKQYFKTKNYLDEIKVKKYLGIVGPNMKKAIQLNENAKRYFNIFRRITRKDMQDILQQKYQGRVSCSGLFEVNVCILLA